MSELGKDITGIITAIIGVAILFVLVSPNNRTSTVIRQSGASISQMLGVAMGLNNGAGIPTATMSYGG